MEDLGQLQRLREQQEVCIEENKQKQQQQESFKEQYSRLQHLLLHLPDKVSHDVMVPVGSVALLSGTLIHTNEIMVLLGDNMFAVRSAKQAAGITDRRIEHLDRNLTNLKKELDLISKDLDFTRYFDEAKKEHDNVFEIKEEVPEHLLKQSGNRWQARKAKHDKTPVTFKFESKPLPSRDEKDNAGTSNVEKSLFSRLDELELEEENDTNVKRDEINTDIEKENKSVRFDVLNNAESGKETLGNLELDSDDTETEESYVENANIIFSHTEVTPKQHHDSSSHVIRSEEMNPGDILKQYGVSETDERPLKSILKKERTLSSESLKPRPILKNSPEHKVGVVASDTGNMHDDPRPILKGTNEAFSGIVVEHSTVEEKSAKTQDVPTKPVSKFKSQRKKMK